MSPGVSRRDVLRLSVAGAVGAGLLHARGPSARAADFPKPVKEAENLTAYHNGPMVLLRWNDLVAATYRAHPTQKYPYFYPLSGPVSGLSLVTESALPYPHHRGLWLGCDPLNGGNYWSDGPLSEGHIRSVRLEVGETTATSATFTDACEWSREGGSSPCRDERRFTFSVPGEAVRTLDVDLTWTAQEDISIQRAKHSFFALRAASDVSPSYGGTLVNSDGGTGAAGTYGLPARWCGYFGKRAGRPDVVEGIAVMDHPENFGGDCPWFTREYGHLSPSPFEFVKEPWQLPMGQSIRLRYRVVLHAGTPKEAGLDALYDQWLKTV
jgi:hypothetical protein